MKFFKWKIFIITSLVCALPIVLGLAIWDKLPDMVAIHFDINNNPDNFAPKSVAVFGLPLLMIALQAFCCFVTDINEKKKGNNPKIARISKWIIPVMSLIIHPVTLIYSTGKNIDIRRVAVFIVGAIFIVLGNYLPKLDYVKNYKFDSEKARKINRFSGYTMVIMGVLFLISLFFPPVVSVACLFLLIPYMIITLAYIIFTRKRN